MPRDIRQQPSSRVAGLSTPTVSMPQSQTTSSDNHTTHSYYPSGALRHSPHSPLSPNRLASNYPMAHERPPSSSNALRNSESWTPLSADSSTSISSSSPISSVGKGSKLKKAFGALRKSSEPDPVTNPSSGALARLFSASTTSLSSADIGSPTNQSKKQLKLQMGSILGTQTKHNDPITSPLPPSTPAKLPRFDTPAFESASRAVQLTPTLHTLRQPKFDPRGSIMPATAGIAAALQYMRENDVSSTSPSSQGPDDMVSKKNASVLKAGNLVGSGGVGSIGLSEGDVANAGRRDSGSNISLTTVRGERPVSVADSLISTYTIVPPPETSVSRHSDARDFPLLQTVKDFSPVEKAGVRSRKRSVFSSPRSAEIPESASRSRGPSQPSSPKTDSNQVLKIKSKQSGSTISSVTSVISEDQPGQLENISPTTPSVNTKDYTGSNIPSRLNSTQSQSLPWQAAPRPTNDAIPDVQRTTPTTRFPAMSVAGTRGSNFAKRAVERFGRAWGGVSGLTSNNPPTFDDNENSSKVSMANRRTPNAPSNSWSISSGRTSTSNPEPSQSSSFLGKELRKPIQPSGGLVFGQDLKTCVEATAISTSTDSPEIAQDHAADVSYAGINHRVLLSRKLPALIVRCTQHLMTWGIHEEGLFRVSGRASHIAALRAEFDTGADFDIHRCSLSDLDPHAVSSIFKAFLRELPEPILTHAMAPFFEAVISSESHNIKIRASRSGGLTSGQVSSENLPSIRKAPSLTTLGAPKTSLAQAPSRELTEALRSLVHSLPIENRHLMQTVAELISTTASRSKQTKMPMTNLLLVFCPSLHMNPPLLRALCDAEGIWDDYEDTRVYHIGLTHEQQPPLHETEGDDLPVTDVSEDIADDTELKNLCEGRNSPDQSILTAEPNNSHPSAIVKADAITSSVSSNDIASSYGNRPLPLPPRAPSLRRLVVESPDGDGDMSQKVEATAQTYIVSGQGSSATDVLDTASAESSTESHMSINTSNNSPADDSDTSQSLSGRSPPSLTSSTDSITSLSERSSHPSILDASVAPELINMTGTSCPPSPLHRHEEADYSTTADHCGDVPVIDYDYSHPEEIAATPAAIPQSLRFRLMKRPSLQVLLRRSVGSLRSLTSPVDAQTSSATGSPQTANLRASLASGDLSPQLTIDIDRCDMDLPGSDLEHNEIDDDRRHTMRPMSSSTVPIQWRSSHHSPSTPLLNSPQELQFAPLLRSRPSANSVGSYRSTHSIALSLEDDFGDDWAAGVLAATGTW